MKYLLVPLVLAVFADAHAALYHLHTVSAGASSRVRVANLSDENTTIQILGFDSLGEEHGPVELDLDARASVILTSNELTGGAPGKGLSVGLGSGTGAWHLELSADERLGGLSYLSRNGETEVLAELAPVFVQEHFFRAHQLADRINGGSLHERLSAYDWIPHATVSDVDLGWGNVESFDNGPDWTRFGGHLAHSAFSLEYRVRGGLLNAYAYVHGVKSCVRSKYDVLPSVNTRWRGVAVHVKSDGTIGYAPAIATLRPGTHAFAVMNHDEFQFAIHQLDLRHPYGIHPGHFRGGNRHVARTRADWQAYQWNPPQFFAHEPAYSSRDPDASPKPTWTQLVNVLNQTERARLVIRVTQMRSPRTGLPIAGGSVTLRAPVFPISNTPSTEVGFFGPNCAEVGGWQGHGGTSGYWAFGGTKD